MIVSHIISRAPATDALLVGFGIGTITWFVVLNILHFWKIGKAGEPCEFCIYWSYQSKCIYAYFLCLSIWETFRDIILTSNHWRAQILRQIHSDCFYFSTGFRGKVKPGNQSFESLRIIRNCFLPSWAEKSHKGSFPLIFWILAS